jgi:hypothetical protein
LVCFSKLPNNKKTNNLKGIKPTQSTIKKYKTMDNNNEQVKDATMIEIFNRYIEYDQISGVYSIYYQNIFISFREYTLIEENEFNVKIKVNDTVISLYKNHQFIRISLF